ncbi:glucosaminidase domain-containing protein [Acinetobacter baumannii]
MAYTYEDKLNFIASIYCSVRRVAFKKDVSWETILAQAAQETGWGEKILIGTNNIFNIKADSRWKGPKSKHLVWEDKPDGTRVQEYHDFRNYKDFDEALEDRVKFLEENQRYHKFFSNGVRGIFEREAQALEDAGYATHKERNKATGKFELVYADKLIEVFRGPSMRRAIARGESSGQCTIVNAVFLDDDNSKEVNKEVEIVIDGNIKIKKVTDSNAIIKGIVVKPNGIISFKKDNIIVPAKIPSAKAPLNIKITKASTPIADKLDQHNGNPSKRETPVENSRQTQTSIPAPNADNGLVSFKIKFVEHDTNKSIENFSYGIFYKNKMKEHVADSRGEEQIRAESGAKITIYVKDFSGKLTQKIEEFNVQENVLKTIKIPIREIKVLIMDHSSTKAMGNYHIISEYRGLKKNKYTRNDGSITLKGLAGFGVKLTIPSGQVVLPETYFDNKVSFYKRALFEKYEQPAFVKTTPPLKADGEIVVSKNKTAPISQNDVRGNNGHPIKLVSKEGTFEVETYLDTTKALASNLSYEIVYKGQSRVHISGSTGRKLHKCEINQEIIIKYKSGTKILIEKYTVIENMSPIKIYITKSKGGFNKAIFAQTLRANSTAKSRGLCAMYVRLAFEAAGGKVNPRPASAYQYVRVMQDNEFREVDKDGYTPQIGDIYIIDRFGSHVHGHISGYDGSQWISDFRQKGINIYRGRTTISYRIFRYYD